MFPLLLYPTRPILTFRKAQRNTATQPRGCPGRGLLSPGCRRPMSFDLLLAFSAWQSGSIPVGCKKKMPTRYTLHAHLSKDEPCAFPCIVINGDPSCPPLSQHDTASRRQPYRVIEAHITSADHLHALFKKVCSATHCAACALGTLSHLLPTATASTEPGRVSILHLECSTSLALCL